MLLRTAYLFVTLALFFTACASGKGRLRSEGAEPIRKSAPIRPAWTKTTGSQTSETFVGKSDYLPVESTVWNGPEEKATVQATARAIDAVIGYLGIEVRSTFKSYESSAGEQNIQVEVQTQGNHVLKLDARKSEVYWELYDDGGDRFQFVWVRVPFSRAEYEKTMSAFAEVSADEAKAEYSQAVHAERRGDLGPALLAYARAAKLGSEVERFKMLRPEVSQTLRQYTGEAKRRLQDRLASLLAEAGTKELLLAVGTPPSANPVFQVLYRNAAGKSSPARGLAFRVLTSAPEFAVEREGRLDDHGTGTVVINSVPKTHGAHEIIVQVAPDLYELADQKPLELRIGADVVPAFKAYKVAVLVDDSRVDGGIPVEAKAELESLLANTARREGFARVYRASQSGLLGGESNTQLRNAGFDVVVRTSIMPAVDTALTANLFTFEAKLQMQAVSLVDGRELGRLDAQGDSCSTNVSGSGGTRALAILQAVGIESCAGDINRMFQLTTANIR